MTSDPSVDLTTWRDVIDTASGDRDCRRCDGVGVVGLTGKVSHAVIAMAAFAEVSLSVDTDELVALIGRSRATSGPQPCPFCNGSGLDVPADAVGSWIDALLSEPFAPFREEAAQHLLVGFDLERARTNAAVFADMPFPARVTLRGCEVKAVFGAYVAGRRMAEKLVLATAGLANTLEDD